MPPPVRYFGVYNADTDPVPPYGLVAVTGVDDTGTLTVLRPYQNGQAGLLVNGPITIPSGQYGTCHNTWPAIVAYQAGSDEDTDPQPSEIWGAAAGRWGLQAGQPGYLILGGAANGRVNALSLGGQPQAWVKVSSATPVSITIGTTSGISAYNARPTTFDQPSGTWIDGNVDRYYLPVNGVTPTVSNRYEVVPVGVASDGKTVWARDGDAASGSLTVETTSLSTVINNVSIIEVDSGLTLTNDAGKAKIAATGGSLTVKNLPTTITMTGVTTLEVGSGLTLTNDGGAAEITANAAPGAVFGGNAPVSGSFTVTPSLSGAFADVTGLSITSIPTGGTLVFFAQITATIHSTSPNATTNLAFRLADQAGIGYGNTGIIVYAGEAAANTNVQQTATLMGFSASPNTATTLKVQVSCVDTNSTGTVQLSLCSMGYFKIAN